MYSATASSTMIRYLKGFSMPNVSRRSEARDGVITMGVSVGRTHMRTHDKGTRFKNAAE